MPVSVTLDKALDKSYENADLKDLLGAPVDALAGVSAADAQALQGAFGIKTVADLGKNKFVRAAVALVDLGNSSG
jgi:hypothetical protein